MPMQIGSTRAVHPPAQDTRGARKTEPSGFEEALARAKAPELSFSVHAQKRMQTHGISMDATVRERIEAALSLARAKGVKETLVVTRDASWIVSVPNAAVITVVPRGSPQGDVFTQIDGAVILE